MFRIIAPSIPTDANNLFRLHPIQVAGLLDAAWNRYINSIISINPPELGHPERRTELPGLPQSFIDVLNVPAIIAGTANSDVGEAPRPLWEHLIYAYMLESTGMYEIFKRVVFEFLHGEKFSTPSPDAHHWLRTTEELFFRPSPHFYISSLHSDLRPDSKAMRCNAYYRMFSMDLPQPGPDGNPYPYHKAEAANRQFVSVLEEFLQEIWVGIINQNNTSGANPTDTSRIANLAKDLHDMLIDRRENGNLSREEFAYVSMFAWFHLTLDYNSPVIRDLKSEASSHSLRLISVGERVGLRAHPKSEAFFRMAEPLSRLLITIETGAYNNGVPAAIFTTGNPLNDDINQIITSWSEATGKDLKGPHTRIKITA